jgi:hypothetical protein
MSTGAGGGPRGGVGWTGFGGDYAKPSRAPYKSAADWYHDKKKAAGAAAFFAHQPR